MPTVNDDEVRSRELCNRLIKEASKMHGLGTRFKAEEKDLRQLTAFDLGRLKSYLHYEMHQLATHERRPRLGVPGPGYYHDGASSALHHRSRAQRPMVPKIQPDINRFTDDLEHSTQHGRSTSRRTLSPLPPIVSPRPAPHAGPSTARGPSMGSRLGTHEDRVRRDMREVGPGSYDTQRNPSPTALAPTMKFREPHSKTVERAREGRMSPGPAAYEATAHIDVGRYRKPSNLMHPVSRVKVQTHAVPGPGAFLALDHRTTQGHDTVAAPPPPVGFRREASPTKSSASPRQQQPVPPPKPSSDAPRPKAGNATPPPRG